MDPPAKENDRTAGTLGWGGSCVVGEGGGGCVVAGGGGSCVCGETGSDCVGAAMAGADVVTVVWGDANGLAEGATAVVDGGLLAAVVEVGASVGGGGASGSTAAATDVVGANATEAGGGGRATSAGAARIPSGAPTASAVTGSVPNPPRRTSRLESTLATLPKPAIPNTTVAATATRDRPRQLGNRSPSIFGSGAANIRNSPRSPRHHPPMVHRVSLAPASRGGRKVQGTAVP